MEWSGQLLAFANSPLGQVALSVVAYLVAKRFPAFQSLVWYVLDAFKISRPNVPSPSPKPVPDPGPSPGPTPETAKDMLASLAMKLLASGQHKAVATIVELARTIETGNEGNGQ